jgi:hypothetical protein
MAALNPHYQTMRLFGLQYWTRAAAGSVGGGPGG